MSESDMLKCYECNSKNTYCESKEVENDHGLYKARCGCNKCGYLSRWSRDHFDSKKETESNAIEEWNCYR